MSGITHDSVVSGKSAKKQSGNKRKVAKEDVTSSDKPPKKQKTKLSKQGKKSAPHVKKRDKYGRDRREEGEFTDYRYSLCQMKRTINPLFFCGSQDETEPKIALADHVYWGC